VAGLQLAIDILARDRASKPISQVGDEVGKTHGKLAALAGAFAGGALVSLGTDFLKGGIADIKAAAAASAQTSAALKSTGGAAGLTQGHIEGLANSLEKMSGVAAENIQAGQNMLLTFTNIKGVNFDAATKTALDMSVALGTDASSSAMQLGKALNDPIKGVGALSKVGVTFDEGQRKSIKSMVAMGNTAGAQQVILKELSKEFGGSAKAAGETMAGKMEILKAKFGDVRQSLVEKLLPAMTKLMDFITNTALPAIQSMGKFLSDNAAIIVPVVAVIGTLIAAFKIMGLLMKAQAAINIAFGTSLDIAFGPVTLIIVGIAALAAGLIYAYKHSETFRKIVDGAFKAVGSAFSAAWGLIKAGFGWLKSNWPYVLGILVGPFGLAAAYIYKHWDAVVGFVKGIPGKLAAGAKGMWNFLKDGLRSTLNWIVDQLNQLHFTIGGGSFMGVGIPSVTIGISGLHHFATGTQSASAGFALVGEQGPEIVRFGGGEQVSTAGDTARMLRGGRSGGGDTYNVYASSTAQGSDIVAALRRYKRESGGAALGIA
jgi:hypothetical protein